MKRCCKSSNTNGNTYIELTAVRQLRSGAVKKFTFSQKNGQNQLWIEKYVFCFFPLQKLFLPVNIKVEKISFEWKSMFLAFSHFNNFFVTHGHIPAIFNF